MCPRGIEGFDEQAGLFSGEDVIRRRVILCHDGLHEAIVVVQIFRADTGDAVWANDNLGC